MFKKNKYIKKVNIILRYIKKLIIDNNYLFLFIFINLINAFLLRIFTIGISSFISFSPLLCDLSLILFFASFGYLFNGKKRTIYYTIISFIMFAICTINSIYFTYYDNFVSVSLLSTSRFVFAVGDAVVKNVLNIKDIIYSIFFVFLLFCFFKFFTNNNKISKKKFRRILLSSFITFLLFLSTISYSDVKKFVTHHNRIYSVNKFGIYIYHLNDLAVSIQPKIVRLLTYDDASKKVNDYYENRNYKSNSNEYTNIFEGKNIIGIHAESIQNFVIGLKINGEEVTPNLNKLANSSLYFNNFYAQAGVGTSSDTEFTLATSLMPSNTGTVFANYYDRTYISIPKLLKEKGYYTFSMHANDADYWNRATMHENLGYDKFYSKDEFDINEWIGLGLSDKSFFKQAIPKLKKIANSNEKYYGTFIMLSNHTPFSEVDKYGKFDVSMTVNGKKYSYLEGTKIGNYLKSVHYADQALGQFLNDLENNNLLEDTVIVLYGDHDSRLSIDEFNMLYNYDYRTNDILDSSDKNYVNFDEYSYELNRKVPLIIYSKGINAKKINSVMGMYDVLPTLGNMFGFNNSKALGHDIFNYLDDNVVVFPSGNWLTNSIYYNSQKTEYYVLNDTVISNDYIDYYSNYSEDLLNVSDSIIVYDLIKNNSNDSVDESKILNGR